MRPRRVGLAWGEPAPRFELLGPGGRRVGLDDYRDRVHLLLYMMRAFNCLASRANVRRLARSPLLVRSGCELLAVAPGSWDEVHRFARTVDGTNLTLCADPAETFHRQLGFPRAYLGLIQSSGPLLIDRDGVVRYSRCTVNPGYAMDGEELAEALWDLAGIEPADQDRADAAELIPPSAPNPWEAATEILLRQDAGGAERGAPAAERGAGGGGARGDGGERKR